MHKIFFLFSLSISFSFSSSAQKPATDRITLPNGWSLSPAGHGYLLGDFPLNMAVSSSGKLIAVSNSGESQQSIQLIDSRSEKILDNIKVAHCWVGLKFSAYEKFLYAAGGNDNQIIKYAVKNKKLLMK